MKAEEAAVGDVLEWPSPPRVVAPYDMPLLFIAPSARAVVLNVDDQEAAVRFSFKNPFGAMVWSDAMKVQPGQDCTKVTGT